MQNSTIFYTGIYNKLVGAVFERIFNHTNNRGVFRGIAYTNCDGEVIFKVEDIFDNDKNKIKKGLEELYRYASDKNNVYDHFIFYHTPHGNKDEIGTNENAEVIGERFSIDKCYNDYRPITMTKNQILFAYEWMLRFNEDWMRSKYGDEYEKLKKSVVGEPRGPFETEKVRMFREDTKSMEVGSDEMKKCMNEYFG